MKSQLFSISLLLSLSICAQDKTSNPNSQKEKELKSKVSDINIYGQKSSKASNIDKKEYTPSQLLSAQNASAAELVNAIPSVNMGNEGGNVSFRGDENVSVMINGKVSTLTGQNLSQIPASSIEKIEVISVPNSKYNSEGSAGIINIVLKKANSNFKGGYIMGSIGNRHKYNGQIGYNWNMNKLSISTAYNFTYNEFYNTGWSHREYLNNPELHSYRHLSDGMKYKRLHSFRLGLDYEFNKLNSISFIGNISKNWESSHSTDLDTFRDKNALTYQEWKLNNLENDINTLYDINIAFTHLIPNNYGKWSIELTHSDNMNDKSSAYNRQFTIYNYESKALNQPYTLENIQRRPIFALQTDYSLNLSSKHSIETGLRMSNKDFRFTNSYKDSNVYNNTWTNDFNYIENLYSMYGLWSGNWSDKLTSKIGLRMEQANTESKNYDSSLYIYNYFKAFPSAMMKYQLSKTGYMSSSYSMRINRPSPGSLNPLQDVADPISKRLGNPKLEPEVIHSFELAYGNDLNKNISFSSSVYYKISHNSMTRFLETRSDGTVRVTVDNLGKTTYAGWEIISNLKLNKKISLNLSSNLSQNSLTYLNQDKLYENSYINWQGRGILNIKLPLDIESQILFFYKSPMNTPQGQMLFTSNLDFTLRKKIWNQKGLITLSIFDILNDTKFGLTNSDIDFTNAFERKRESRYVTLNFRYNFGKESSKKPKVEKPMERESGGDF